MVMQIYIWQLATIEWGASTMPTEFFTKLKELHPSWAPEYIDPYLNELKVKVKNSKPEALK